RRAPTETKVASAGPETRAPAVGPRAAEARAGSAVAPASEGRPKMAEHVPTARRTFVAGTTAASRTLGPVARTTTAPAIRTVTRTRSVFPTESQTARSTTLTASARSLRMG